MSAATRVTARRTPRQARSAETLERILDAAAQVFSRHGYASGTTNRIASEASMSIGSLYQYFPNKDAILLALARRHVRATADQLRACFVEHHDPDTLIPVVIDAMVDVHAADAALHEVLFEQAPRSAELVAELAVLEEELVVAVASLLREAPEPIAPERVVDVARVLVATVESLVHRLVATSRPVMDVRRFRDELVTMVHGYVESSRPEREAIDR